MKKLSNKDLLLVGLTLFSMFFGAGNLIFPPFLGREAGVHVWIAMAGFALSAIGLPVLGVVAVAKSDGLSVLAGRVNKHFAFIFTMLAYLSIGPGLAIPRTASTSFEMVVAPFIFTGFSVGAARVLYSVAFFGIALILAMNPDKLTERMGKVLTPCLLVLIVMLFVGCLVKPIGNYGVPVGNYNNTPLIEGFLGGYQTMDAIAALIFGIIISMNIRAKGVQEERYITQATMKAGLIAGFVLFVVYGILAHIGGTTGTINGSLENGAVVLTRVADALFGKAGMILVAAIFFIACLNTCIGLLSSCSKYFTTIIPRISYHAWVIIFAVVSLGIANIGLNQILKLSVPILHAIYPIAIVLIVLAFLDKAIGKYRYAYSIPILFTGFVSVVHSLHQAGIELPLVSDLIKRLPLYQLDLAWIMPALIGIVVGILLSMLRSVKPVI